MRLTLILLSILFINPGLSQNQASSPLTVKILDSLIVKGYETDIQDKLKDSGNYTKKNIQPYIELFQLIDKRRERGFSENLKTYEYYYSFKDNFSVLRSGEKGNDAYKKFKDFFIKKDNYWCAYYLQAALFYRQRYIENQKIRLISNYNLAVKYYDESELDSSRNKVIEFKGEDARPQTRH